MSLNIALQMDPPQTVNIHHDSSYALGREAQRRGYHLHFYPPESLSFDTKIGSFATMQPLIFNADSHHPATLGDSETRALSEVDVILMRQDPPFNMEYITATYLLEYASAATVIVNNPKSVREAPEKLWVNQFQEFIPRTLITRNLAEIEKFRAEIGKIIVKPLYGNGGYGILLLEKNDPNLAAIIELFTAIEPLPVIAQQYIPAISQGDKRIILIDGKIGGLFTRIPQPGHIRSNLHVGGKAISDTFSKRDYEICEALGPKLKAQGLIFTGIDVIGDYLTEINITSPTGIVEMNHFNATQIESQIWDAIESKLS